MSLQVLFLRLFSVQSGMSQSFLRVGASLQLDVLPSHLRRIAIGAVQLVPTLNPKPLRCISCVIPMNNNSNHTRVSCITRVQHLLKRAVR